MVRRTKSKQQKTPGTPEASHGMYGSTVQVDAMIVPQPLAQVGEIARRTQAAGFSGLLFTETGRTAYLNAAVASQAAPGLELSTGVAVAFPRSPFVTAAAAWELQEGTKGKFRLGLGTQVRRHVVRRYSAAFEHPGPRLRDYVLAVKACFAAFRTGTLDHHGEFYDLDFISPQWSPGPIDAPDPKVDIAAVNPWMLRMAGEVADGVHVHPLGEPGYLARHVMPDVAEGAAKSGRSPSGIAVIVPVMTIVGDSDEERRNERELVRASMSFYASTPNYAFIMDEAGFEGTTARIREKQKAGDFKGMASQITDEHIAHFATESTWDGLEDALIDKYQGIATRIVLYNALGGPERFERYGEVARRILAR
jgi:probable F420-dependent oxidoreductase